MQPLLLSSIGAIRIAIPIDRRCQQFATEFPADSENSFAFQIDLYNLLHIAMPDEQYTRTLIVELNGIQGTIRVGENVAVINVRPDQIFSVPGLFSLLAERIGWSGILCLEQGHGFIFDVDRFLLHQSRNVA